MTAILQPFPFSEAAEQMWQAMWLPWEHLASLFPPTPSDSVYGIHAARRVHLAALMSSVQPLKYPGHYRAPHVTVEEVELDGQRFGDQNSAHCGPGAPHPRLGRKVAHGMRAVTLALSALKQELQGTSVVPETAHIEFRKPVFPDEDAFRILITPSGTLALTRSVQVFARSKVLRTKKLVAKIEITLKEDQLFDDTDWQNFLMGGWQISALLAEKNCLYYSQFLRSGVRLQGNVLKTHAQGAGYKNGAKKLYRVLTKVVGEESPEPIVGGEAVIVLP